VVRETLAEMCPGARRCGYCEDSLADEVEHIKPKNLYPELTFVWENYLYACGPCNVPKNNRFAVFSNGDIIEIGGKNRIPGVEPIEGQPVFLNPRAENPLDYIELDLLGTFLFIASGEENSEHYKRGKYSIKVLGLNDRGLPKGRRQAYKWYRALLNEYADELEKGAGADRLEQLKKDILEMDRPAVWREMQRKKDLIPDLKTLFERAYGAEHW
jgi:uncharacterized protein (TIGR02646 family)